MSSYSQCPVCGDVMDDTDPDGQCSCVTTPVSYYAMTDAQRAAALTALSVARRNSKVYGIPQDDLADTMTALSADPLIVQRVVGIRRDGQIVPLPEEGT